MNRKKIISLALMASMAISIFTGCGTSTTGSTTATTTKAGSTETTAAATTATAKDVTISIMVSGTKASEGVDFELDQLPALIHAAMPNVTVEVTKLPDDQYYTSLTTKLASGEAPDMFLVQPRTAGTNGVATLAKAGYLADLSDLTFWDSMPASGVSDMSYNKLIYGIPQGVAFLGAYYNKDIFAKYNLAVPTTWAEFTTACETLKSNGVTPIVSGDKDSYVIQFPLYQMAANEIYSKNAAFDSQLAKKETSFTDGAWDNILTMYTDLYAKGYVNKNSLGYSASQAIQMFIDGQAAIIVDGSWDYAAVTAAGSAKFERGFLTLPSTSGDNYVSASTGAGYGVYAKSANVDTCKAILNLMCDGKSDLFKAWAANPRIISTYAGQEIANPLFKDAMASYSAGKAFYFCNQAWPAGVETEMEAKLSEIIGGESTTVKDVTAAMQAKYDELTA